MKKLPILLVLALATGAQAQTLEDAVAAYQKGELETAAQQFAALAEAGDAKAQYNLAVLYEKGEGVAQDSDKALAWYQKAAEAGNVNAQYNLGLAYETGEGVTQDYGKARAYYEKAAAQGDADAQNNLGGLYARGDGVKKDLKKAREWLEKRLRKATKTLASVCWISKRSNSNTGKTMVFQRMVSSLHKP